MSTSLRRGLLPLLFALAALAAGVRPADAQRLGLEAGVAGVENFETAPTLGASLFLPLTDRLRGVVTYNQWTGCDHQDCSEPRAGYGNHGLNVLGLFQLVDARRFALSAGAGLGWYEKYQIRQDGRSDRYYEDAMTVSGELRVPVAYNSATYLRADVSVPTEDNRPRWGFVRLGVDVGIF